MTVLRDLEDALNQQKASAPSDLTVLDIHPLHSYRKTEDRGYTYDLECGMFPNFYQTIGIGGKTLQEDTSVITTVTGRARNQVAHFLEGAFNHIQRKVLEAGAQDGATANVAYISKDHVVTVANTGGSRTFLLIRDVHTGNIETKRLSYDHSLADPKEQARVRKADGALLPRGSSYVILSKDTVDGENKTLSTPRGFGNPQFPGITHLPDITQVDVEKLVNNPDKEVYVVNASDGLFRAGLHEQDLAAIVKNYFNPPAPPPPERTPSIWGFKRAQTPIPHFRIIDKDLSPAQKERNLSHLLVCAALQSGSNDNITVNVVKLSNTQAQDIIMGVFDGHQIVKLTETMPRTASIAAEELAKIAKEPLEKDDIDVERKISRKPFYRLEQHYPVLMETVTPLGPDVTITGVWDDQFELTVPKAFARSELATLLGIRNEEEITRIATESGTHSKLIIPFELIKKGNKKYLLDGQLDATLTGHLPTADIANGIPGRPNGTITPEPVTPDVIPAQVTGYSVKVRGGSPLPLSGGAHGSQLGKNTKLPFPLSGNNTRKRLQSHNVVMTSYSFVPPGAWFQAPPSFNLDSLAEVGIDPAAVKIRQTTTGTLTFKVNNDQLPPDLKPSDIQQDAIGRLSTILAAQVGDEFKIAGVNETGVIFYSPPPFSSTAYGKLATVCKNDITLTIAPMASNPRAIEIPFEHLIVDCSPSNPIRTYPSTSSTQPGRFS